MLAFPPERYGRVLEIGCDEGDVAARLHGEVWGVAPDADAAAIAAGRQHRVLAGIFEATRAALPLGYFDVVVCNDVIGHLPDHDRFRREIRACIAPGRVPIGSVPNMRHLPGRSRVAYRRGECTRFVTCCASPTARRCLMYSFSFPFRSCCCWRC